MGDLNLSNNLPIFLSKNEIPIPTYRRGGARKMKKEKAKPKKVGRKKLNWDELFMNLALLSSKRTACIYHQTGAVFVDKRKRIISVGYNGPTEGDLHCLEVGCAKVDGDPETGKIQRCRGAHAEINGLINVQMTTRLQGATAYLVLFPCYDCMKAMNNAGIREIIYYNDYLRVQTGGEKFEEEEEAWALAKKRGIKIRKYQGNNFVKEKVSGRNGK